MNPGNGNAPELGGEGREVKQQTDIAVDHAAIVAETQPIKPEIDLESWSKLGGISKPSRTERKAKRSWIRGAK